MRLIRSTPESRARSTSPLFFGNVDVQRFVGPDTVSLRLTEVTYRSGARNRLHTHTSDQLLFIAEGDGIVATATEELRVSAGDIVFIPAAEPHWHGAQPDRDMTHWSVQGPGTTEVVP